MIKIEGSAEAKEEFKQHFIQKFFDEYTNIGIRGILDQMFRGVQIALHEIDLELTDDEINGLVDKTTNALIEQCKAAEYESTLTPKKRANLSKIEAITAMQKGEKITHVSFLDHEWIKLTESGWYEMEDGTGCQGPDFWKYRTHRKWESGWSIFEPKP